MTMTTDITSALTEGWRHPQIDELAIGQEAWAWSTGALRLVTVKAKARTRVTIGFTQKDGRERTKVIGGHELFIPDTNAPTAFAAPCWIRSHHDRRTLVMGTTDIAVWTAAPLVWIEDLRPDAPRNTVTGKPFPFLDHDATELARNAQTLAKIAANRARLVAQ